MSVYDRLGARVPRYVVFLTKFLFYRDRGSALSLGSVRLLSPRSWYTLS